MLLQHIEIRVGSSHVARREPHEFTLPRLVDYRGSYSPTNLLHTLKAWSIVPVLPWPISAWKADGRLMSQRCI